MLHRALCLSLLVLWAGLVWAEEESNEYRVGDTWIYKSSDPKADSMIVKVTGTQEEAGKKLWSLNIKIGNEIIKSLEDDDGNTYAMYSRKDQQIRFDPPLPGYKAIQEMKVGEEKTIASECSIANLPNKFKLTIKMKRDKDETVTVPAGTFENSMHYVMEILMNEKEKTQIGLNLEQKQEIWASSQMRWYVKSVESETAIQAQGNKAVKNTASTKELQRFVRGKSKE